MKFMLTSVFAVSVSARMYGPGSGFTLRRSANASANLRDSTSSSHGRDSEVSSTGGKPAMLGDRPLMVPRGSSVTLSDVNAVGDDPG